MPAIMKSKKMSITQTYYLAHTARSKLSKEASRGDHDLRVLVGHANLLDGLMGDLATAEREQDLYASSKRVTWADDLPSPTAEVSDAEVSDASDSSDDEAEDIEIDDETDSSLALVRTPSRSSPPELLEEEDEDDSDDDSMPPSPPAAPALTFSDKKTAHDDTTAESFYEDGFYLPRRGAVVVY